MSPPVDASLFGLGGRIAAVTGANTGLGRAIAEALAGAGADVALVGRSDPEETIAAIEAAGRRALWVKADLGAKPDYTGIVRDITGKLGGLHVLVNNAGIIRRANAIDFTEEDWDAVLDVNLKSVFFLSQAAARHMIASGGGKIINIASMLSFQGGIRVPSYTASKSGIAGLTRLLANEWASSGINVNAIAPGYFATHNTAALQADAKRNAEILGRIPAGRWGNPADLGGAAIFLSSNASNYVHGIILPVDGGWLAR
ncbi:MAG TPA: 2-dehydro-3-deoxy-D-gluconate 5-dehydrogenase KduD [Steroidobacteraceae bacterium]|nr:2-dehydro-3-deoxy-D-gluconate 5-dehydrogenase KduD [Steroidobacteraceae bacterium]